MGKREDLQLIEDADHPHLKGRKIKLFEKERAGLKSRALKHGVNQTAGKKFKKPLLVIGTGRCGTTWLSQTLQAAEFDVPHECVGEHGSVSMFFQKDADWYPFIPWEAKEPGRVAHVGERRSDFTFNHVVHLVRHPLEVAASMQSIISQLTMSWFEDVGLLGEFHYDSRPAYIRNLRYWVETVKNCEAQADQTIDINRFKHADWVEMLVGAGLDYEVSMPKLEARNKSTGYKKHEPWTMDMVKRTDKELYEEVSHLTKELGLCRKKR